MGNEALMEAIDAQSWLGELADSTQPALRALLESAGGLKDVLHGKFLGHPLHPMLTDIPVGAWTASMLFDAIGMIGGGEALEEASDGLVAFGLLGAVASAVTGATDWSETDGRARKIGLLHGMLNLAAAGLYASSLAARRSGSRQSGIGLSMLGYAIASFSAYLGGHLTYGEQIGVDHTATSDAGKPEEWTAVEAREDELLENVPKRVMANQVAVVLVRQEGEIRALTDTCSHLGGPLAEGRVEGDSIRCPWHGSRFCLRSGEVLDGPATFPARPYEVRVIEGRVLVRAQR